MQEILIVEVAMIDVQSECCLKLVKTKTTKDGGFCSNLAIL